MAVKGAPHTTCFRFVGPSILWNCSHNNNRTPAYFRDNQQRGQRTCCYDYFDSYGGDAVYCHQLRTYGECLSTGRFGFFLCWEVDQSFIGISYRMGNGYGLYAQSNIKHYLEQQSHDEHSSANTISFFRCFFHIVIYFTEFKGN